MKLVRRVLPGWANSPPPTTSVIVTEDPASNV
jgi:hypothetical protein